MKNKLKIGFAFDFSFTLTQITNFIKNNWLRETLLSDESFFKWQFLEAAENNGNNYCVLAVINQEIVGFLGLNKRSFILDHEMLNGAELTTWIINEKFRRKGIAKPMQEYVKQNFDVVFGANITLDALKVYLRLDFNFIKEIDRVFKILSFDKVSKISTIDPVIKKVYKKQLSTSLNYREIGFNEMKLNQININGFERSFNYLLWRYEKHPYYKYNILEINNTNTYIIFRLEQVESMSTMIITDILTNENDKLDISSIEKFAENNKIDFIEFYSTNAFYISSFINYNYISSSNLGDFIDVPYLYNPLELKKSKSYSLIYYAKDPYKAKINNYHNINITKADCDLDRPNYDYLIKEGVY